MPDAAQAEPIAAEATTIPTNPIIYAEAKRAFVMPSPAEYICAFAAGGSAFDAMQEGIRAAAPDVLTTDTPGILPVPIIQPTYNNFVGSRPVVDAFGARAMPAGGKVFIRPIVTTHTSIGVQSTENTQITEGTFVVDDLQVTKGTYGGTVSASEQVIDFTVPEVIGLILDDMGRIYANQTDNVAADGLVAGATNTNAFGNDATSPEQWAAFIGTAAQDILSASNGNLPTHLFVSPNMWGYLLGLVDTTGRPLFPQLGPMNAYGDLAVTDIAGMAFGLRVVVDRNFATDTVIVGDQDIGPGRPLDILNIGKFRFLYTSYQFIFIIINSSAHIVLSIRYITAAFPSPPSTLRIPPSSITILFLITSLISILNYCQVNKKRLLICVNTPVTTQAL